MMVLSIIYPIVLFDVMENDYDINASTFMQFYLEKREELATKMQDQLRDLGFENHNAFLNLGTISFVVFFTLVQLFVLGFMKLFVRIGGKEKFESAHWFVKAL